MASPISHIVYASDFLDHEQCSLSKEERDEFIAGSLLPDIVRLLPNASRELTHNRYSIDLDLSQLDPFHAGWKFHLYCDKAREYFLKKNSFYDIPHAKDCAYAANKFLEDMLVYDRFGGYGDLSGYLCGMNFSIEGVDKKIAHQWYCSIARYMEEKPNPESIKTVLREFNTSSEDIEIAIQAIQILKSSKQGVTLLELVSKNILLFQKEKELQMQLL